jgi:hypothetical protein
MQALLVLEEIKGEIRKSEIREEKIVNRRYRIEYTSTSAITAQLQGMLILD